MSRTTRNHIPRCQCCCNPRHSAHGNKKEKLTMQERKEESLEIYSDERLAEFAEGEAELERHEKYTLAQIV